MEERRGPPEPPGAAVRFRSPVRDASRTVRLRFIRACSDSVGLAHTTWIICDSLRVAENIGPCFKKRDGIAVIDQQ